jgi:hypothetical protein
VTFLAFLGVFFLTSLVLMVVSDAIPQERLTTRLKAARRENRYFIEKLSFLVR